jgi:hypothetical protein
MFDCGAGTVGLVFLYREILLSACSYPNTAQIAQLTAGSDCALN